MESTQTLLVTDWGHIFVTPEELQCSGAKWSRRGSPINMTAALLMDFCSLYARDDG